MNHLKTTLLISKLLYAIVIGLFLSCGNLTTYKTEQPKLSDYTIGESWVWKYKGVSDKGEVRSNGEDARKIVDFKGGLGITVGNDTIPVSELVKPEESETPRFKWPLEVGKKWKYETEFTSAVGIKGKWSQDAEVISYEEVTVEAGTFMAYTIEYKGAITNSNGMNAKTDDVWIYAPKVKNFIKMTQVQEGFSYTEELIKYSNPNKK